MIVRYELPPDNRNCSDDELLADLRRVSAAVRSEWVGRDTYEKCGRFSPATLVSRFGSWNEALTRACLKVAKRQSIPSSDLLADLCSVATRHAASPVTRCVYRAAGQFSPDAIERRFGGWRAALTAAGLDASHLPVPADNEGLFSNLEQVWEHLGRAPKRSDMRPPLSQFSSDRYARSFGSWRAALKAFVESANSSDEAVVEEANARTVPESVPIESPDVPRRRSSRNVGWRLRFLVLRRDGFKCKACGASASATVLHIDHVLPWSRGGETVIENLQTLCEQCNVGKGTESNAG